MDSLMTPACVLRRGHLGISLPMASKHVTRLEQQLGTRLLNGKRRLVTLAENAALYFEQIQQMRMRLDEVKQRSGKAARYGSEQPPTDHVGSEFALEDVPGL